MKLIRTLILIYSIAAGGVGAWSQNDGIDPPLRINWLLSDFKPCGVEDIAILQSVLADIQTQADYIPIVANAGTLRLWISINHDWINDILRPRIAGGCLSVRHLYLHLDRSLYVRLFNQVFRPEREVSQDDNIHKVRELLDADQETVEDGEVAASEWLINRTITDLPPCTVEEALDFFNLIDSYEREVRNVLSIPSDDAGAVKAYAEQYETWAQEALSPFYERPCGETLVLIHFMETIAYSLVFDWLYYDKAAESLDSAIQFVQDRAQIEPASDRKR